MKIKICTSVEQSNKLTKLGININTADMSWQLVGKNKLLYLYFNSEKYVNHSKVLIPAWSLSALLELIPPYLGKFNDGIDFGFGKAMNGKWYSAHYLQTYPNGDIKSVKTVTGDTAVDAAFEMVCWLKENNKL